MPAEQLTPTKQGGQRPCTGTQKDGSPCGMKNRTTKVILPDGNPTWRCRHHRADLAIAGGGTDGDVGAAMPSTRFRTIKDAERFCQWVMEQGARNRMNGSQVNALMRSVREYNQLRQQMTDDCMKQFKELLDRAHDEYTRLREISAAEIGTD